LSATVTKLAISQLLSQQLYYVHTTTTLEITLRADNGCCTRRPRL